MRRHPYPALAFAAFLGLASPLVSPVLAQPVAQISPQLTAADIARAGPLQLGMSQDSTVELVGPPTSESPPVLSPATALFTKVWSYPDQGLSLTLAAQDLEGPYALESLTLKAPSIYTVTAGICVGMLEKEAYNRFKLVLTEDINSLDGPTDDSFGVMVMSTYTVLSVSCSGGQVQQIYLGPGPE